MYAGANHKHHEWQKSERTAPPTYGQNKYINKKSKKEKDVAAYLYFTALSSEMARP